MFFFSPWKNEISKCTAKQELTDITDIRYNDPAV